MTTQPIQEYTRKDFQNDEAPRWCAGCGDFSIFNALTSSFAKMGIPKEKFVIISGIGCSSRLPYYTSTYGFHTLHGRASVIALGTKMASPDLSVWVVTGDGDALSIGGNHFIHTIRRNPDINIVIFNNEIYGLTKGQLGPTSPQGAKTKSSPYGSIEAPLKPLSLAIAAGATFVARCVDTNVSMMTEIFIEASKHKGISVIEVLSNCIIFNDGTYEPFENKASKDDTTVVLKHGEALIFGKERNKGIVLDGFVPKVVTVGENGVNEKDLLVHDAYRQDPTLADILARAHYPELPLPVGIFRKVEAPVYEAALLQQERAAEAKLGKADLHELLTGDDTWQIH